jgi:membrane protease YdiL (CAAX protease family)
MGIALALVYAWRRILIASVVMHFLRDILAIVILPLLSRGG